MQPDSRMLIANLLQKMQVAKASPTSNEVWIPTKDYKKETLPEQKFEHFDVHPAMKEFWKTKQ